MKYRGIIFDLDGTLLDTLADLTNAMNSVLAKHGFAQHSKEQYRYFIGNGMENLVRRTLPQEQCTEDMVALCLQEFHAEYKQSWANETKPYAGITELLVQLAQQEVTISVLSNKADPFTKVIIDKFFGAQRFACVLGARPEVPKKPNPAGAIEIVNATGIAAASYLYVGDSGVDMKTANAAGMYAVGVTWGFRDQEELMTNGAHTLVQAPADILALLS